MWNNKKEIQFEQSLYRFPAGSSKLTFLPYLLSSFFNCQHIKNMQFNNHAEHFWLQYCRKKQSID